MLVSTKAEVNRVIDYYSKVIALNDQYNAAYFNRGNCYGEIEEYDKAISDFTSAIAIAPTSFAEYYSWRAYAFECRGRPGDAVLAAADREKSKSLKG